MDDIKKMIEDSKTTRIEKVKELVDEILRLKKDPDSEFTEAYKSSIEELSAKDGLTSSNWGGCGG